MIRSFSLKLAMLAITMGVVFWIRWHPAELQPNNSESVDNHQSTSVSSIGAITSQTSSAHQADGGPTAATPGVSNPDVAGHAVSTLIDLNSATLDELESLPGLGAVLAQRVIAYRQSVGRFQMVEDLREVKGIGAKKFDQIKSRVTVAREVQKGKTEKRPS